ncbi:ferritin-like protein [Symbiobacterium terraclitae]|uniref:Ferritin-like protein n=1 Tax=Symbiobacterium terraclitae TaxID=557451 RepID=A0ABS4JNY0_9FIRM|nr:ferritin-like domain-containing protein [Symbiobacterium terraclitae]MBP2017246.1 ferritin-like protein [Symbiobacterium terraclitae]
MNQHQYPGYGPEATPPFGGMMPGGMGPGGMWPGGMGPGGVIPGGMMPGGMMPGGMMPGGMMPGGMMPGGMMPGGMMPGGMMPGGMMPGGMMPGGMTPGGMAPGDMMRDARPEGRPMGDLPESAPELVPAVPALPLPSGDLAALARRIPKYLQDEVTSAAFYRHLAGEARDEKVRGYLEQAAADEDKHFRLLSDLYFRLTGRRLHPTAQRVPHSSHRDGLLIAANDGIKAYGEYEDEYQRATDPYLRWLFFELLSDEIGHAVRLNTILHMAGGHGE